MIPSTNNKLLVSEDWKKIYQSFRSADFKSYDFETLRRTMISYLQENYPEDFNDFIDSSEYIALVDLIAYLGQNLSFRIDLNARENFIETAQRRDSILRLAQLISYNPSRNVPANGFLKLTAVSTTDNVFDSNGTNLANAVIVWNDSTNPDWYQQFINIMNSAMTSNFGNPVGRDTIDGILTEQYRLSSSNQDLPIFNFSKNINGTPMSFEIVPCIFTGKDFVYEEPPAPAQQFSMIYKNDNQGSASGNTGFFVHFRQGSTSLASFSLDNPVPNEIIGLNTPSINNSDVWLWQLDKEGRYSTLWTPVPSLLGNNIIYNSINKNIRTIYAITTRDNDQIDLNFADGVFGDLPKGEFRIFYRQSNGLEYVIKPEQMSGVTITIPYTNPLGQGHNLQMTFSLQYTVNNGVAAESDNSIRAKAPQTYYVQNRMITGEDYNIAPLNAGPDILKVKSVNRISSGLSKYFDISDVTGRYSKTNIFASDGILYREEVEKQFEFSFTSRSQVLSVIKNKIAPIINSQELKSFYINYYSNPNLSSSQLTWVEINKTPGQSRGYFIGPPPPATAENPQPVGEPTPVGKFSQGDLRYLVPGAAVKFLAPSGKYFDQKNNLKDIPPNGIRPAGSRLYIWSTMVQLIGDGSNAGFGALNDGTGPVIFSSRIPSGAKLQEVIPKYVNIINFSIENEIANICMSQKNFGLSFNSLSRNWEIILNSNLDILSPFSLDNQGNVENQGFDSSWMIAFVWTGVGYQVRYRTLNYIFESEKETAFYIDNSSINFDFIGNTVVKDRIDILSSNQSPLLSETEGYSASLGVDYVWQIDGAIIEPDGYVDPKKIKVSFYESTTGQAIDPESFDQVVADSFVFFKKRQDGIRYELTREEITPYFNEQEFNFSEDTSLIDNGSLFYFYDPRENLVKYWDKTLNNLVFTDEYFGRVGRSDLKFYYTHNSGQNRRIDPSKTNIIDVYLLTNSYDNEFRSWLLGNSAVKPLAPTTQSMEKNYSSSLNQIKAISDEIVFNPVQYKVLFGEKADLNLQAKFKAVRNPDRPVTDNDIKARILSAINDFFILENWDFGQSFYFSELSTFVMNRLTPDITNFIIVPVASDSAFGSLYEVACLSNEIFITGATVSDIDVIDAVTAAQIKSSGMIVLDSGI
jgi:hypothetical protein